MLYGSQHHIDNISNPKGKKGSILLWDIYARQILSANNRRIQEIKEGDILSFRNAGAYCYSMAQTITRDINQQKHCG
jgi:diaminopimelate decarboxylase